MGANGHSVIRLDGVTKVFFTDEVETHALSGIHLQIGHGEFISIAGPSGCGKSTLLSILGLLDTPTSGGYWLNDKPAEKLKLSERARIRNREIGFIFQSFNLIPDLDVFDNVDVPLRYRRLPARERRERIERAVEMVGLLSRLRHLPAQLSGGQQQRVAIARVLAGEPRLILADEPTGNLDTLMSREVMDQLERINEAGTTIVMVTHTPECASRASRQIHLLDGEIVDLDSLPVEGPPEKTAASFAATVP